MSPLRVLAVEAEYGGPFEVPPIGEIFNLPELASVAGVEITRYFFIVLFAVAFTMLLFGLAFSSANIVPGKLQALAESIVEFIREQIAIDIIGPDGRRFVPFLTTLFMFVFFNNIFKIIPFVNYPSTSRIALPFVLAIMVLIIFTVVGIRSQGAGYFREIAFPPGVPPAAYVLLTPIELISTFVLRPLTLTVRLFANMVAGHMLLVVTFLAIHAFLRVPGLIPDDANLLGLPIGVAVLAISPLAVGFEGFISLLQAYIFTILTAVYIGGALHPEH